MRLKNYTPLALLAEDADDLNAISAVLQDAVLKIRDMAYMKEQRRFALVANRFVWEDASRRRFGPYARVRAGLHFDDVIGVKTKSVRQDAPDAVVDVLALDFDPAADGTGGTVTLQLAGGGEIALTVGTIAAEMRDISEPWRTPNKPNHGA